MVSRLLLTYFNFVAAFLGFSTNFYLSLLMKCYDTYIVSVSNLCIFINLLNALVKLNETVNKER